MNMNDQPFGAPVQGGGNCPICGASTTHRFLSHRQGRRNDPSWSRAFCSIEVAWFAATYGIDVSRLTAAPGWGIARPLAWWRSVDGVALHVRPSVLERIGTPLARKGEETLPAVKPEVDPDYDPSIF